MLKKILYCILLTLLIVIYVAGIITGDTFVYILGFVMLGIAILFVLLSQVLNIIWGILPANFKINQKKTHFKKSIFFSVVLFFFLSGIIDWLCIRHPSILFHYTSNIGTFIFAAFCAWSLIKQYKGKTIIAASVVFILFTALLSGASYAARKINFTALRSGRSSTKSIDNLLSLGYVDWVPTEEDTKNAESVMFYHPQLAFEGINMYQSRMSPEVYLMDMRGNILHKWGKEIEGAGPWNHVDFHPSGDLLVGVWDQMLVRLDWNSKIKWKTKLRSHHDTSVGYDNDIYALGREDKLVSWHGIPLPIVNDYIMVLSPDGGIKKKIDIYEIVKDRIRLHKIARIYYSFFKPEIFIKICYYKLSTGFACKGETILDVLHTNSIEVIDRDIEGFCKKGDWLVSIHKLDFVGILDVGKKKFVWSWGPGEISGQHHPTLLDNGNVLIFDNGFENRCYSRVVELNPLTKKIVWEYKGEPQESFYSTTRGDCQRLPNGNTLIVESNKGHVFEVRGDGKIVWDFYNPDMKKKTNQRAAITRMLRITDPQILEQIKQRI